MSWPIIFTVPGVPVALGRHRVSIINGHAHMYDAPKSASYKGAVAMFAHHAMDGRPPLDCAVTMKILVLRTVPKSWSKKKQAQALSGDIKPVSRPDVDNYTKAILDGIIGIVFHDDTQVTTLRVGKRYAEQPSVIVTVEPDQEVINKEVLYGTQGCTEHHGSE